MCSGSVVLLLFFEGLGELRCGRMAPNQRDTWHGRLVLLPVDELSAAAITFTAPATAAARKKRKKNKKTGKTKNGNRRRRTSVARRRRGGGPTEAREPSNAAGDVAETILTRTAAAVEHHELPDS